MYTLKEDDTQALGLKAAMVETDFWLEANANGDLTAQGSQSTVNIFTSAQ